MKRFILNGAGIADRGELHSTIAAGLEFPVWYGNNLDALHDCLTDIFEPTEIVIENCEELIESLGGYASIFIRVLQQCAEENENIIISVE